MKKELAIEELMLGEKLGRDLFDSNGRLLLKAGIIINGDFISSLSAKGIKKVYVEEDSWEQKPDNTELERLKARQAMLQAFTKHYQVMNHEIKRTYLRGKYLKAMQRELFESLVELLRLLQQVADHDLLPLYYHARGFSREKTYSYANHATNTGILCALLSRWLDLDQNLTAEVTLVGYLHDIGKSRLPVHILEKPGPLNQEELKLVQTHPVIGASILTRTTWITPKVILGVLRHHERLDGSGYPYGIMGSDVPFHARIVAVAGAFDTITSPRPYAPAMEIFPAIAHLRDQAFGQLDALITRTLYNRVLQSYDGQQVELITGEYGTISCRTLSKEIKTYVQTASGQYDMNVPSAPAIKAVLK